MKRLLILIFFMFFTISSIYSINDTAVDSTKNISCVKGTVIDSETGELLTGVQVKILNTNYTTYTDMDGNFILHNIKCDRIDISLTLISYKILVLNNILINDTFEYKLISN